MLIPTCLSISWVHRAARVSILAAILTGAALPAHATVYKWTANGHGYEAVLQTLPTWEAAQNACAARGGYLSTITSEQENCLVYTLFGSNSAYWFVDTFNNGLGPWFGGRQIRGTGEPVGQWEWITGEPWAYTNWSPGQPDNCCNLDQNRTHFFRPGYSPDLGCQWDDAESQPPSGYIRGYIFETDNPPADAPVLGTPAGCCGVVSTLPSSWGRVKEVYR